MSIQKKSMKAKGPLQQGPRQSRHERRLKWERLIQEWKDSGLSQVAFCKKRDLNQRTFQYQLKKMAGKKLSPSLASPQFMKLEMPVPRSPSSDALEVRLSCGTQLTFTGWSNTMAVLEVIRGLKI